MSIHFPEFIKQGHRGARGLRPENTISSMIQAIEDGANFIELDVQITRDEKVVVTHDPMLNRKVTLTREGKEIPETVPDLVICQMAYEEIRQYDVGSKENPSFPQQQHSPEHIPELGELIDFVENHISRNKLQKVIYNIENKSDPNMDGLYQPGPKKYINLVMEVLTKKLDLTRYQIQSFDFRQLREVHEKYPSVVIGVLIEDNRRSLREILELLGFTPQVYSPCFHLVTPELILEAHTEGMKFVPWTVNELEEMKRLKSMGVDGIITDYPHLLKDI